MVYFILFLLGLCIGSFLNCLVYRLNHNLSPLLGRSICPKCKKKIFWQDNIPLLSFVLLRGKCRFCHSPIDIQYPLVELATGVLFLISYFWIFSQQGILDIRSLILKLFYYWVIGSVLIAIFTSDLRYGTIPDGVVYPAVLLVFIFRLQNVVQAQHYLKEALLAGLGAGGFFLLLVLVTRGRGMGIGDVKLAGLMGLILGWPGIVVALVLAFLTGALVGVILILMDRKHFGEHIPFGPFLSTTTWIALLWGERIFNWYQTLVFQ